MWDRLPRPIRVLYAPRQVFAEIRSTGRGFGDLFYFLALELLLVVPGSITSHVLRLSADPLGAVQGLWSLYVSFVLQPAVVVFFLGIGAYYRLRKTPERVETWTAASVVAYA